MFGKCGTVRVGGHVAGEVRGAGAETRDRSDFTSESVLRQKEACREAVEKCRAGRGAHIQWGRDQWYNTGLQQNSILRH